MIITSIFLIVFFFSCAPAKPSMTSNHSSQLPLMCYSLLTSYLTAYRETKGAYLGQDSVMGVLDGIKQNCRDEVDKILVNAYGVDSADHSFYVRNESYADERSNSLAMRCRLIFRKDGIYNIVENIYPLKGKPKK